MSFSNRIFPPHSRSAWGKTPATLWCQKIDDDKRCRSSRDSRTHFRGERAEIRLRGRKTNGLLRTRWQLTLTLAQADLTETLIEGKRHATKCCQGLQRHLFFSSCSPCLSLFAWGESSPWLKRASSTSSPQTTERGVKRWKEYAWWHDLWQGSVRTQAWKDTRAPDVQECGW